MAWANALDSTPPCSTAPTVDPSVPPSRSAPCLLARWPLLPRGNPTSRRGPAGVGCCLFFGLSAPRIMTPPLAAVLPAGGALHRLHVLPLRAAHQAPRHCWPQRRYWQQPSAGRCWLHPRRLGACRQLARRSLWLLDRKQRQVCTAAPATLLGAVLGLLPACSGFHVEPSLFLVPRCHSSTTHSHASPSST